MRFQLFLATLCSAAMANAAAVPKPLAQFCEAGRTEYIKSPACTPGPCDGLDYYSNCMICVTLNPSTEGEKGWCLPEMQTACIPHTAVQCINDRMDSDKGFAVPPP